MKFAAAVLQQAALVVRVEGKVLVPMLLMMKGGSVLYQGNMWTRDCKGGRLGEPQG